MHLSPFASAWRFDPAKPRFRDYPTVLADDQRLPELEVSLDTIGEYQRRLWANRNRALLLAVHGPDTSGKDSLVRTLATYVDPAGFRAQSFSRPTEEEARHDFLWRVSRHLPGFGELVTFNRSHHEAVISERVWPVLAPSRYDWAARYQSIRDFERHLVREGTLVLKVWLNLSEAEHRKRLLKRLDKPRKRWKFDKSDIDGWQKRGEYEAFAQDAMAATDTDEAPWFIVPGDDKPQARAVVAALLAEQLQALAPEYPAEDEAILKQYRALLAKSGVT